MSKFSGFFNYLKTITITIIISFFVLLGLIAFIQHNIYEDVAKKEAQSDTVEYYLIGLLIEKNKYLEAQSPNDYRINIKLGILYELYKDAANAEAQYKLAIDKAPYGQYKPVFKLASLYAVQNKLEAAQKLMDNIKERPHKELIGYKAEIYFKLGEKYYNMGDYRTAVEKYQKSLFYYERIRSPKIKFLKQNLASSYIHIAEEKIHKLEIQEAIDSLLIANDYFEAPIIEYKLALLLMKDDPDAAYKYFEKVFEKEPSIINFHVYYNFLTALSDAADIVGNVAESELYHHRAKKFKEYFQSNILSVDDIEIEMAQGVLRTHSWNKKCAINLRFQLKNTSDSKINSLFVYIIFKDGNETITDYAKQIIDVKSPLEADSLSPLINIKIIKKMQKFIERPNNITAEIYVSKIENSYKIHLITLPIVNMNREAKWKIMLKQFLQKLSL